MKDRLPDRSWLRHQASLLLPGCLAALALVLPSYRYRFVWGQEWGDLYVEFRSLFLFGSDLLTLLAVGLWLLTPWPARARRLPRWLPALLIALAALATLSAAWAPMPVYALYQAVRLWLLLGLFLVVATTHEGRSALMWGLLFSVALQAAIGLAQFWLQRSVGWHDLGEVLVRPEWSGAAIVETAGKRILRAYGLTQHPNILGGILAVGVLLGAALVFTSRGRSQALAIGLTALAFAGLLFTFSRAAWLGLAVGAALMAAAWTFHHIPPRLAVSSQKVEGDGGRPGPTGAARAGRPPESGLPPLLAGEGGRGARSLLAGEGGSGVRLLLLALFLVGLLFVATQWQLLMPRLGLDWAGHEIRSTDERATLTAGAWVLIRERPWLGVGYGNFTAALWRRQPAEMAAYPLYQPVHTVPLLAAAELGIPGVLLWLGLMAGPWLALRRCRPDAFTMAVAAALAAFTVISFYDFYPWFSQQGRLLQWLLWGLFAQGLMKNQVNRVRTFSD